MTAHSSLWVKGHGSKPSFPKAMPRRIPRSAGRTQQEHVSTCCFTLLLRCAVSTRLPLRGDTSSQAGVGALGPQEAILALGSLSLVPGPKDNNSDKHVSPSPATPTSAWQSPQIHALGVVPSLLPAPALGAGTLLSRAPSAPRLEPRSFQGLLLHFPRRDSGTVESSQNSSDASGRPATLSSLLSDSGMPLRCWYQQVCSGPSCMV